MNETNQTKQMNHLRVARFPPVALFSPSVSQTRSTRQTSAVAPHRAPSDAIRPQLYALGSQAICSFLQWALLHPFREGNGWVAQIVSARIGLQAGLPSLYFDNLSGRKRQEYFAAVRAGLARNYEPMTKLFIAVIERTLQIHGK
jgi:hypothetical protein